MTSTALTSTAIMTGEGRGGRGSGDVEDEGQEIGAMALPLTTGRRRLRPVPPYLSFLTGLPSDLLVG